MFDREALGLADSIWRVIKPIEKTCQQLSAATQRFYTTVDLRNLVAQTGPKRIARFKFRHIAAETGKKLPNSLKCQPGVAQEPYPLKRFFRGSVVVTVVGIGSRGT